MLSKLERIEALVQVGIELHSLLEDHDTWEELCLQAINENPWFVSDSMHSAVIGMIALLEPSSLYKWANTYSEPKNFITIGVIMAGNLPFVGFHDALSVLISGHTLLAKMSTNDQALGKWFFDKLNKINPELGSKVVIAERLNSMDAVIATGSDNTSRYFEYYFGKYPHVIRKNRNSIGIITGLETEKDISALGQDIFQYFGLGCRSVSKLLLPKGYDVTRLFPHWEGYKEVIFHNRYANNFEYNKSLLLINKVPHLDTGFLLVREESSIASSISVLHYEFYDSEEHLLSLLHRDAEKLQCVALAQPTQIPATYRPVLFGTTQLPTLWDYADGVDVMAFLTSF